MQVSIQLCPSCIMVVERNIIFACRVYREVLLHVKRERVRVEKD